MPHPLFFRLLPLVFGLISAWPAAAAPVNPQDFLPNCNIRQLNLSAEQQEQLRQVRNDYKQAAYKAIQSDRRFDHVRKANIQRILSVAQFDENLAQRYVSERYAPSMQFAVEELSVQHKLYQLLTPQQQALWLQNCVR